MLSDGTMNGNSLTREAETGREAIGCGDFSFAANNLSVEHQLVAGEDTGKT